MYLLSARQPVTYFLAARYQNGRLRLTHAGSADRGFTTSPEDTTNARMLGVSQLTRGSQIGMVSHQPDCF